MFFIHGGAYVIGGSQEYPAEGIVQNLVNRGVVVVTTNYRLNVFGFFSNPSQGIRGNFGLLDQIMALNWVQAEIEKFGGDPNRVTLFGESAGAGSTSILSFSPLAQGLFAQLILESGSAFCPWALRGNDFIFLTASRDLAVRTKCSTIDSWKSQDSEKLLECMQNVPAKTLFQQSQINAAQSQWKPVVDGEGGVLPDWPRNLANQRLNKPMIVGTNRDEMANFMIGIFAPPSEKPLTLNNFTREAFEYMLETAIVRKEAYGEFTEDVRRAVRDVYSPKVPAGPGNHQHWANATVQAWSGIAMFAGAVKDGEAALGNGNPGVYYYSFDYLSDGYPYSQNFKMVGHAHELFYLFRNMWQNLVPIPWVYTQNDIQISELLGILWTNFAKTGNPLQPTNPMRVQWDPITDHNPGQYLSIGSRSSMQQYYRRVAAELFNEKIPEITGREGPELESGANLGRCALTWFWCILVALAVLYKNIV